MEKQYQSINGTFYHLETRQNVINVLENARLNNYRIRVHYGDTSTGRDWNEMHYVTGYVGRSTGSIKIPLLVYNKRSYGGGAMLDHCIVKITESKGKRVLYQHPLYHYI